MIRLELLVDQYFRNFINFCIFGKVALDDKHTLKTKIHTADDEILMESRDSSHFTDTFYDWLTENTDIVRYIQIDSLNIPRDPVAYDIFLKEKESSQLLILSAITNFLNLTMRRQKPKKTLDFPPPPPNSSKSVEMATREIKFLQQEEYDILNENFNNAVNKLTSLIDFLAQSHAIPAKVKITILTEELFRDLQSKPKKAEYIKNQTEFKIANLCMLYQNDADSQAPDDTLLYIFGFCIPRFNHSVHFLELNSQQDRFNRWLFSPTNPIDYKITEFLENFSKLPRRDFTNQVFKLFGFLKEQFPQKDPILGSIFVIMFIRAIFDACIAINYAYFFPHSESRAYTIVSKIQMKDINPPKEFLPIFNGEEIARDVFMRDPRYRSAGTHVTAAFFQTNPLDALFEIHLALKDMHAGIASRRKPNEGRQVLPFETIFTLFFGSLLTADLPDLEGLVKFIVDFAPAGRLAPEFQYAQVTMNAVLAQFETFISEKAKSV